MRPLLFLTLLPLAVKGQTPVTLTLSPTTPIAGYTPVTVIACIEESPSVRAPLTLSVIWIRQQLARAGVHTLSQAELNYRLQYRENRRLASQLVKWVGWASLAATPLLTSGTIGNLSAEHASRIAAVSPLLLQGATLLGRDKLPPIPPFAETLNASPCAEIILLSHHPVKPVPPISATLPRRAPPAAEISSLPLHIQFRNATL